MTLDSIIRISATIEPSAASTDTFGRTLLLYDGDFSGTTRAAIAGDRARDLRVNRYTSLAEVGEDYATTHPVYTAAAAYFAQTPFPRDLLTASYDAAGAGDYILGATGQTGAAQLTAIKAVGSSAAFRLANGKSVTVDLASVTGSGDTGFTNVATEIQTALRTITSDPDLRQVTVTYDAAADAFTVAAPIGVDLAGVLSGDGAAIVGLASTATYYAGRPAETIAQTLERIQDTDDSWYWLVLTADLVASDSSVAAATWVRNERKQAIMAFTDVAVLTPSESASRAAQIVALDSERNTLFWSARADYKDASAAARFAGTDFGRADSLPTLFGKSLPGRTADSLSAAQRNELDRKRINYYEQVGGHAIVRPGQTTRDGWWTDTRFWLDWLTQRIQNDIYDLLRTEPRIPLTDYGVGLIQAEVEDACEDGVRNGGIAPGKVSEATAGEIRRATGADFDGTLSRGYLVWVDPLSEQSLADRQARKAPPVTVWLKGSGAVHSVDIAISFTE